MALTRESHSFCSHPPHVVAAMGIDNITATCLTTSLSDLNGDCVTDFYDFALFAEGWLGH
ncbi:hypothetical protein ACFL3F_04725 [Planctomycetota bacterium]